VPRMIGQSRFSRAYRRYALIGMSVVYTFSMLDQGLISLVLQPIKVDLRLTDTQLGFLTGIAFGLVYAALGVPIARWVDVGNRSTIASLAIGLWGLAVMSVLLVGNFVQLIVVRVATAVAGAGGMPPTYSLLGDYFPASAERTRAMTIYMLANPVALLASFLVGGKLTELYGWRAAFFLMGIPALFIAGLVKTTIAEPRTRVKRGVDGGRLPSMTLVVRTLWHKRSARHLVLGLILIYTTGLGLAPWYAAFMMRSHGMGTADLGVWLGLAFGVGGTAGVWIGGYAAGRWFAEDERAQMRFIALTIVALVPCFFLFLLLRDKSQALMWFYPFIVLINAFFGPAFALLQRLVADEMRATTLAIVMLLCNLIGMGTGPEVVGAVSDWLVPIAGQESLRYAMLTMSAVTVWAAFHFWHAGTTVKRDLLGVNA
jgi:MFS family permease